MCRLGSLADYGFWLTLVASELRLNSGSLFETKLGLKLLILPLLSYSLLKLLLLIVAVLLRLLVI